LSVYHVWMDNPYEEAVAKAGSIKAIATALNESLATVCNWRHRGIPPNKAKALEALTGISVRRLRPNDWHEYWPESPGELVAQQEASNAA
jgi:hypothetical protein